ncbi:hypothetical protein Sjap_011439 [Stephania japonica]|uniref:Uncharacterized protein n=1 Tax=Stephania japonica TaxID=461633 RepID=A0AAP0JDI3_9MAGN
MVSSSIFDWATFDAHFCLSVAISDLLRVNVAATGFSRDVRLWDENTQLLQSCLDRDLESIN